MNDIEPLLNRALDDMEDEFRVGELAYLAATTKVEHVFRDRLAHRLHQLCPADTHLVSREWRRVDLAILGDNDKPVALIELKAMYTADAVNEPVLKGFTDAMRRDAEKIEKLSKGHPSLYVLLLATHLSEKVGERFKKVVKYARGINLGLERGAERLHADAIAKVEEAFKGKRIAAFGEVKGGRVFGTDVSVLYWLIHVSSVSPNPDAPSENKPLP